LALPLFGKGTLLYIDTICQKSWAEDIVAGVPEASSSGRIKSRISNVAKKKQQRDQDKSENEEEISQHEPTADCKQLCILSYCVWFTVILLSLHMPQPNNKNYLVLR